MKIIIGTILALAATAAFASSNSGSGDQTNCNGNGSCATTVTGGQGGNASASATGGTHIQTNTQTTVNTNTNVNTSVQGQGQHQGQIQGQGQGQKQSATATNAGNKQSTTVTFEGDKQIKQAPGVAVAGTTTTASCMVAVYGGVSFPGGSVAAGSAYKDKACDKRALGLALIDTARVAAGMGAQLAYFVPIFERGMALLDESGSDDEKSNKLGKAFGGATSAEQLNP